MGYMRYRNTNMSTARLDKIVSSLHRCAFLLHKIENGDPKALTNAPDAVDEAVILLRQFDEDADWMEYYQDDDPPEEEG